MLITFDNHYLFSELLKSFNFPQFTKTFVHNNNSDQKPFNPTPHVVQYTTFAVFIQGVVTLKYTISTKLQNRLKMLHSVNDSGSGVVLFIA